MRWHSITPNGVTIESGAMTSLQRDVPRWKGVAIETFITTLLVLTYLSARHRKKAKLVPCFTIATAAGLGILVAVNGSV